MEIITKGSYETKDLGRKIGAEIKIKLDNARPKNASIIALIGDLGSGKTTFVQGLAEGLGLESRIISPTFILMRKYFITDFEKTPGSQPGDESNSDMSSSLEETPRYQRGEDVIKTYFIVNKLYYIKTFCSFY